MGLTPSLRRRPMPHRSRDAAPARRAGQAPGHADTPPPPPPVVTKDRDGTRRLRGRRYGELRGERLFDPTGRPLLRGVVRPGDSHFAVEWAVSAAQAGGTDTHWLYLLPDDHGGTLVVEVHPDEVGVIRRQRLTLAEIRLYLGLTTRAA